MTRRNRGLPSGEIVDWPLRGLFTGNRGCLHDTAGLVRRRWTTRAWICCRLDWKGVRRQIMAPGRWTEIFFLDEAVALAAGHRPCALCRRADYERFRGFWPGAPRAPEIDAALHPARILPPALRPEVAPADLPDGAFVLAADGAMLLKRGRLGLPLGPAGYGRPVPLPTVARRLTPAPIVAVLAAGYRPILHPDAQT